MDEVKIAISTETFNNKPRGLLRFCVAVYAAILCRYFLEKELEIFVESQAGYYRLRIFVFPEDTFNSIVQKISEQISGNDGFFTEWDDVHPMLLSLNCNKQNIYEKILSKQITIILNYHESNYLIDVSAAGSLARSFKVLFDQVTVFPDAYIHDLHFIDEFSENKILTQWSHGIRIIAPVNSALELIIAQVTSNGDKEAIVFDNRRITYNELLKASNKISNYLKVQGVQKEQLIGVFMEQSIEFIFCILGIQIAGAAYIPFDPEYPSEMVRQMVARSRMKLYFCSLFTKEITISGSAKQILVDDILNHDDCPEYPDSISIASSDLAYVMFTSGSTGVSKGVLIEHKSLLNQVYVIQRRYNLSSHSRVILQSSPSFDSYVAKVFPVLSLGGTLVLLRKQQFIDVGYLKTIIDKEKITYLTAPPSMVALLNEFPDGLEKLQCIGVGGEVLKQKHINNLLGKVRIFNVYGPTEVTVSASCYELCADSGSGDDSIIPIGRPNANYSIYILDKKLRCMPVGCPGELFVGGVGVARGYLSDEDATSASFIGNPFCNGSILYKTGDLGMWDEEGNIIFLGRLDSQVKINGFRVELEEIELALSKFPSVRDVAVVYETRADRRQSLNAYLLCDDKVSLEVDQVNVYLRALLPEFMIPQRYFLLSNRSYLISGKLDRKSLPSLPCIELKKVVNHLDNQVEKRLQQIVKDQAGILVQDPQMNILLVGVNSLSLFKIVKTVEREFDVRINMQTQMPKMSIREISGIIIKTLVREQPD